MTDYASIKSRLRGILASLDDISRLSYGRYDKDLELVKKGVGYCMEDVDENMSGTGILRTMPGGETKVYKNMDSVMADFRGKISPKMVRNAIRLGTHYMCSLWDYCDDKR